MSDRIKGGSTVESRRDSRIASGTRIPPLASYACVGLRFVRRCLWPS